MMLADGLQWNEKQHRGRPPYPWVLRSETHRGYVKLWTIPNAIY